MRLALCIALGLALNSGLAGVGLAQVRSFDFIQIDAIETEALSFRELDLESPFVRERELPFVERSAPEPPDSSLARPITRLALDAEVLRGVTGIPARLSDDASYPLLTFTLGGVPMRMAVIEARADSDFSATHFTLIAIDSNDYARITVSRSEPELIGTAFIDDKEFRILPVDGGYQFLYPVVLQGKVWQRESAPNFDNRRESLEARHLQMGWIAENPPERFSTLPDGRPRSYAGTGLGRLHFWDSFSFDAAGNGTVDLDLLQAEAERFVNGIGHFTWIYDYVELRLVAEFETDQIALSNEGFGITLVQYLDEIPIDRSFNLRMDPTGEVIAYEGVLMRRNMVESANGFSIPQDEAHATAKQLLVVQHGVESEDEFLEERQLYDVVSDTDLDLVWSMRVAARCGMIFNVEIDGITGQGRRISLASAGDFEIPRFFFRNEAPTIEDYIFLCRYTGLR